jgi:large subunit ribosomal protein L21
MFAIVTIAGQQFKVEEGQELFVHQLDASEGDQLSFDQVHLVDNDGSVRIGTPTVKSAKVGATVLGKGLTRTFEKNLQCKRFIL